MTGSEIDRGDERSPGLRIVLVQPLAYLFAPGGAHKANRHFLHGLAARGHRCWVVAPPTERIGESGEVVRAGFAALGAEVVRRAGPVLVVRHGEVAVHAVDRGVALCQEALRLIREVEPDWTIVSEDSTFLLLSEILNVCPRRAVCFAHSPATLPFGPASFAPDAARTDLVRRAAGVLTVSRYLQDYIRRWAGIASEVVYSPVYGAGPFPRLAAFDRGFVTVINPSAIKGISVFAELARRLPEVPFAAVLTWGATEADRALLAALPNVRFLPVADDLDQLFAQVRVLVVPSLWGEAFGQVVVEAMLRGVPVLVSDQGGLPEASQGAGTVVPVRPIERYEPRVDERGIPMPVVPEQDAGPWVAALERLLADRALYEQAADAAYAAAHRFVAGLGFEPYERFLRHLAPAPAVPAPPPERTELLRRLAALSPERLELLRRRVDGRS